MIGFLVRRFSVLATAILAATLAAACAYQSGDEANPFTRKFTWFSFVGGDDVRAACRPGASDRFRLIYNGIWLEQVRIYEVNGGAAPTLHERVIVPDQLTELSLSDPFAPWRGVTASLTLHDEEYAALLRTLAESGAYTSPAETLTLRSDDFYWTAASCHGGAFHLTAWRYPSDGFNHLTFAAWLNGFDRTGIPFNPPRPWWQPGTDISAPKTLDRTAGPERTGQQTLPWTIGIAQDRMVDVIVF